MNYLEKRIEKEGKALDSDILKVGSFLNQQVDVYSIARIEALEPGKITFKRDKNDGKRLVKTENI